MVQECPQFLQKGLMELFPGVKLKSQKLSVITLSEKTVHDMTGWSSNVEEEREQLLEHVSDTCTCTCTVCTCATSCHKICSCFFLLQFVDSAKEICSRLTAGGYFADFIDPSSGRAVGLYIEYTYYTSACTCTCMSVWCACNSY